MTEILIENCQFRITRHTSKHPFPYIFVTKFNDRLKSDVIITIFYSSTIIKKSSEDIEKHYFISSRVV